MKDELALLIKDNDPDIVILTELVEPQHNSKHIREILSGYSNTWVILAVKKSWTECSMVTIHEDSKVPELKSHFVGMMVQPPDSDALTHLGSVHAVFKRKEKLSMPTCQST